MLIVRGLSGTGKTTLATALADRFRLPSLHTDCVRNVLFADQTQRDNSNDDSRYHLDNRRRVYDRLLEFAEDQLRDRCGVVLDGTFLAADARRQAIALARRYGALPLTIECRCPDRVARQRIATRQDQGRSASDAYPQLVSRQRDQEEPSPPDAAVCEVDTTSSPPEMLDRVIRCLRRVAGAD